MSFDPSDNELIEQYLLGKLNEGEMQSLESRLRLDRELARKLRLFSTFPEMMSRESRLEYEKKRADDARLVVKEKKVTGPAKRRYLIWGVCAFFVLGLTFLFIYILKDGGTEKIVPRQTVIPASEKIRPVPAAVKDTQVPAPSQLQPSPEKTVNTTADDAAQKPVDLLRPADGMKFSREDMILFKWKQKTDTFTRFYIISELNDHVILWRGIPPGTTEYKVPGNSLFSGEYYWYVGTKAQKRTFTIIE